MNPKITERMVSGALALLVMLGGCWQAQAQAPKTPYPSMAPLDQYLMTDRNAEIALARSAAPDSISRDATILVFGRHGYETAIEGKNGFVCVVERAWMSPSDHPEFWNPSYVGRLASIHGSPFHPAAHNQTNRMGAGRAFQSKLWTTSRSQLIEKNCPVWNPEHEFMMSKHAYLPMTTDITCP